MPGKVYAPDRAEVALQNFFRLDNLAALRELVLRELAEDVEARRHTDILDPLSQHAVAERILALVTPEPRSQRILRRAWRSSQRLGSELDALWMRKPDQALNERRPPSSRLCAVWRACSARISSRRRETTWSRRSSSSPASAARRTSSSGRPTRRVGARSCAARWSRRSSASSGHRHPCRRRPGLARGAKTMTAVDRDRRHRRAARSRLRFLWARRRTPRGPSELARRVLVPFTGGALEPTALAAAIRYARAEEATLVPAYLLVVPLELPPTPPSTSRSRSRCRCSRRWRTRRSRRGSGRRAGRERPQPDPCPAAALGGRALRPDRRARPRGAGDPGSPQGSDMDAGARAERARHPAARPGE